MPKTEKTEELIRLVNEAAKWRGLTPSGSTLAAGQTPLIWAAGRNSGGRCCGPAGGGAHSPNEYLRIDTIEERITMIRNVLTLL